MWELSYQDTSEERTRRRELPGTPRTFTAPATKRTRVRPVWRHDNEEPVDVAARNHRSRQKRLYGFSSGFRFDLAASDAATQELRLAHD